MTIVISIKVNDGIVLAADSATTSFNENGNITNVYKNAHKVFNLYKGLPIGCVTWNGGNINTSSIETLIKDFRKRLMGVDGNKSDLVINEKAYTVTDVANKLKNFIFDEHYKHYFENQINKQHIGFIVTGFSPNSDIAEEYRIEINGNESTLVKTVEAGRTGIDCQGDVEVINRLINGYGLELPSIVNQYFKTNDTNIKNFINLLNSRLRVNFVEATMPIHNAIDLAHFLVDTTIKYYKHSSPIQFVGEPIEIATITKHEGYKWIRRNNYFDESINTEDINGNQH